MNTINTQIHSLTDEAMKEIREYLRNNGDIKGLSSNEDSDFCLDFTAVYFRNDGNPYSGYYENIYLSNNEIVVDVVGDGDATLHEDELTTNHVLDIMNIINEIEQNK